MTKCVILEIINNYDTNCYCFEIYFNKYNDIWYIRINALYLQAETNIT